MMRAGLNLPFFCADETDNGKLYIKDLFTFAIPVRTLFFFLELKRQNVFFLLLRLCFILMFFKNKILIISNINRFIR